jgi:hypothetical protein
MARKITLFELHVDGINFGAGDAKPADDGDMELADVAERADRRVPPRARRAFAIVGAVVLASVVRRRLAGRVRGNESEERDIAIEEVDEYDDEAPDQQIAE